MNLLFPTSTESKDHIQARLMSWTAGFILIYAISLTLAPAARLHSWNIAYRWTHWPAVLVWIVGFALLHRQTRKYTPDRDPYLLPIMALLSGWGLLTIWRLTPDFGIRQTLWLIVCQALFWFGLKIPNLIQELRHYKYLSLSGILLLIALTLIFGAYPGGFGPRLWLGCCGIYFQPAEALKLLMVVYLAAYLSERQATTIGLLQILTPAFLLVGSSITLLAVQRDLGTASLLIILFTLIVYLATGKRRVLLISAGLLSVAGLIGYQLFDVIRVRVEAWLNPWLDASGRSYQIVQSLLAFASGGFLGSGPGLGSPSVVPIAHSDFIFAAIGEESGLLGGVGLLLLLSILTLRGLKTAIRAANAYQRLLAGGITTYLISQSILIIGGNLRLLPLTGVTLPFVSYGGSSLLISFLSLLILLRISNDTQDQPSPLRHPEPYWTTAALLLTGLFALTLLQGWWSIIRSPALATRPDNPRRIIADRYVLRGQLLDRNNQVLAYTEGQPGNYLRRVTTSAVAPVIGYHNATYGQSGAEFGFDGYLRGLQGTPTSLVWYYSLLFSQPPPGLDVRLSLELNLQQQATQLLEGQTGALVLLNANTGEILAMASSPSFDPNQIEQQWPTWLNDQRAPLLNRAVQGLYPPGQALIPFLLADQLSRADLPNRPLALSYSLQGQLFECSQPLDTSATWNEILRFGCPTAALRLSEGKTSQDFRSLYEQIGFSQMPALPLPSSPPTQPDKNALPTLSALGQDGLRITPLQMALAASALNQQGNRPAPRLGLAVNTPTQGWIVFSNQQPQPSLPANGIVRTLPLLAANGLPIWEISANALGDEQQPIAWYLSGVQPSWQGTPLTLVIVLEDARPLQAAQLGHQFWQSLLSMQP
ncbi:MAG: FtsW/RodA/SpoVE family cell cycle protein [Anaerolinea sp.]|nr:FtsW/RodA/SpoVE family cell cycle protein [Anaerolinea sp.]